MLADEWAAAGLDALPPAPLQQRPAFDELDRPASIDIVYSQVGVPSSTPPFHPPSLPSL
jgi:hypothetical protein